MRDLSKRSHPSPYWGSRLFQKPWWCSPSLGIWRFCLTHTDLNLPQRHWTFLLGDFPAQHACARQNKSSQVIYCAGAKLSLLLGYRWQKIILRGRTGRTPRKRGLVPAPLVKTPQNMSGRGRGTRLMISTPDPSSFHIRKAESIEPSSQENCLLAQITLSC